MGVWVVVWLFWIEVWSDQWVFGWQFGDFGLTFEQISGCLGAVWWLWIDV